MVQKKPFSGTGLSDDALDMVVGGSGMQGELVEAHPELQMAGEYAHDAGHGLADARSAAVVDLKDSDDDNWGSVSNGRGDDERSEFAEAAQEAFMQAWNDGDTDLTPEEAFNAAADTMRELMEESGMPMDNFETDLENAFEVFNDAIDDGENPMAAFEMARESVEEANRNNLEMDDGRD